MNLGELIEHTRKRILRDAAKPPLWSDEELTLYFNEAQDQFARRTHCLLDEESDFTVLETEVGVRLYTLDERIVYVSEMLHEDGTHVRQGLRSRMNRGSAQAKSRYFSTDAKVRQIRLYPEPDDVYTIQMLVARKPLERLAVAADEPEIDEDYHITLCEWAAHRALRNNDVDGANMIEADKFRLSWEIAVRVAKLDVMRFRSSRMQLNNWTGK